MNRTLAVALIAIGAIVAVLGILQHQLIIRVHIDHLAVILLAVGVITMVAGIFGFVMQGRSSAPVA
jgi:ABC-type branched-subunit amino acid transport system permease subunit